MNQNQQLEILSSIINSINANNKKILQLAEEAIKVLRSNTDTVEQMVFPQIQPDVEITSTAPQPVAAPQGAQPITPAVPITAPTYTLEDLALAGTQVVDMGRKQELLDCLGRYGVQALTQLPKTHYSAFAGELRALGAQL
ncbi:MAG: hypothetical protein ACOXZ0_08380 [Eubacteriales bacterium]|jgi:hypothetical protein